MRLAQAQAFWQGRTYVIPDDVKSLAEHVLSHRVFPASYSNESIGATDWKRECIRQIIAEVRPPDG